MLTSEEREKWDRDPSEWPHTPPLHVFLALMDEDDNTWWRAGLGHGLNAFDAAIERIEELEALVAKAWDEGYDAGEASDRDSRYWRDHPGGTNPYRSA